MAYVGISQRLLDDVTSHIHKMSDEERNAFATPPQSLELDEAPQAVIDLLWGEHRHLEPLLPDTWKSENSSVDLNFEHKTEDGGKAFKTYFTVTYAMPVVAPPNVSSYRFDVFLPENVCPSIPEAEAYHKWSIEMWGIECRWTKVHTQIINFLKSCKSLNEALKLWPDVRIYTPNSYITRVEQKSERSQSREAVISKGAAALANVDTDGAISAAMTARMMGTMQGLK